MKNELALKFAELLDRDDKRIVALETQIYDLKVSLILALKQSGIDLATSLKFVESKVPTLHVPVAAPVVLTTSQKLKPGPSGVIPPPPDGAGDSGAPSPKGTHEQQ